MRIVRITIAHLFVLSSLLVLVGSADGRTDREPARYRPKPRKAVVEDETSVELDLRYDFSVPGKTKRMEFLLLLPQSIPDRQKILSVNCRPKPSRMFSENGNRYAEFTFSDHGTEEEGQGGR